MQMCCPHRKQSFCATQSSYFEFPSLSVYLFVFSCLGRWFRPCPEASLSSQQQKGALQAAATLCTAILPRGWTRPLVWSAFWGVHRSRWDPEERRSSFCPNLSGNTSRAADVFVSSSGLTLRKSPHLLTLRHARKGLRWSACVQSLVTNLRATCALWGCFLHSRPAGLL